MESSYNETVKHIQESEEEDHDDDSDEAAKEFKDVDRYWPPPVSESLKVKASSSYKTITALNFNNSGTRFAAGGHDHEVSIWDFQAINTTRPEAICNSQPCGQSVIKNLSYSNDDELVLVVSGSSKATIIAKDGILAKQYQCAVGDQYLTDMANTKGHVQMLNDGDWSPKENDRFITCSNDATIRIWDLNKLSQQSTVIKTRSPASGLKAVPNVCKYSRDGLSIISGCNEGSVLMWDTRRKFISTSACIKNAHLKGSEITGIEYSYSSNKIATRSEDETCKIWDTRQLKAPLATRNNLSCLYSSTDCSFSPDDKYLITGTSGTNQEGGCLYFLDATDLSVKETVNVQGASVIRSRWHPRINHIAYSCSDGFIYVAHDEERSMGGFLTISAKGTKRKNYQSQREGLSSTSIKKIITPHSLPIFREDTASTSFAKIRQDPKRSYKPQVPVVGANKDGQIKPTGSTLSSYIARNIAKPLDDEGLDIRERILRHAEEAEEDPIWVKPVQKPNK